MNSDEPSTDKTPDPESLLDRAGRFGAYSGEPPATGIAGPPFDEPPPEGAIENPPSTNLTAATLGQDIAWKSPRAVRLGAMVSV